MKGAGAAWNTLDDAGKKKYNEMAAKDAERFKKQTEEVKEKGFFLLEDGSKSTDHMVKIKKDKSAGNISVKKIRDRGTQTVNVTFTDDLDFAGAIKIAK